MAVIYTQTDTDGGQCSSLSERLCSEGGTAGSTPVSATIVGSGTGRVLMVLSIAGGVTRTDGTWTPRINITTGNMNLTITNTRVVRIDNSPSCTNFTTYGTDTTDAALSTTGVKTFSVSATGVGTDPIAVEFEVTNGAMTDQAFSYTPNQNIDTPFTAVDTLHEPSVNDAVTLTESVSLMLNPALFSVNDTVTVTESVKMNLLVMPNVFDAVTLAEFVNMNLVNTINVSDDVTVAEAVTMNLINMPNVFDGVTVAESVSAMLNPALFSVFDAVTVTEALTMNLLVMPNVFDSVSIAEDVTVSLVSVENVQINVNDSIIVDESVSLLLPFLTLQVFEDVTVSEGATIAPLGDQPSVGFPAVGGGGAHGARSKEFREANEELRRQLMKAFGLLKDDPEVEEEVAEIVAPYVQPKRKPNAPIRIDWSGVASNMEAVRQLLALYEQRVIQDMIDRDDEEVLLLL